ncbi:STE20-related kinase adapter protein alpha-like [Diaphorina citri]|uniref:STE20-related kinase adapter protein alpha-like n=2 Tax=Diaphorina citri TaxID=121845 RepID=A0A1S3DSJ8_DIACI|nr:STE20-related kinase adapter protein alpha-like [Diaphorina citri]KAI5712089.1 hypothetical protein M8J75_005727 [Diaphorina citri]
METLDNVPSNYKICSILGQCFNNLSSVYLSKHKVTNQLIAVKKFNLDRMTDEDLKSLHHEIVCMRHLRHPNIICYISSFLDATDLHLVSPLMGFGSCKDLINAHFNFGLPELVICHILQDVLNGLEYIHGKGFIHRAVKASHILISHNGKACLSGLRYMCPFSPTKKKVHLFPPSTAYNLNWLSPEVLEQNLDGYDERSDIYSVGISCCELANGTVPFAETPTTLMLIEKLAGATPHLLDCTTYYVDTGQDDGEENACSYISEQQTQVLTSRKFSDSFHSIVELCLSRDVDKRPLACNLLQHAFFKQTKKCSVMLPELLRPALSLNESNVCEINNELECMFNINDTFNSSVEVNTIEWKFDDEKIKTDAVEVQT